MAAIDVELRRREGEVGPFGVVAAKKGVGMHEGLVVMLALPWPWDSPRGPDRRGRTGGPERSAREGSFATWRPGAGIQPAIIMVAMAEIVGTCRIGISPEMKKDTAPAHLTRSSSARTGGASGSKAHYANVLLELAGRDGDVKLPLMSFLESLLNTTSGFGISLVAQWLFLPAIGVAITFEKSDLHDIDLCRLGLRLAAANGKLHIRIRSRALVLAVTAQRQRQIEVEGWMDRRAS
jgi:hypothetical protein